MKGVTLSKVAAAFEVSDGITTPKPAAGQLLVKSVFTAINPVEGFQQQTGMLISSFPIVLGCDASGIVVEVGEGVEKFEVGDGVFGCTKLGEVGCGTFQEYFVMDADFAFKKPDNISVEQAATIGAGVLTASLGLYKGVQMEQSPGDEWIIILGGAGSVGQYAIQLAKIDNYKILTTCSPKNNDLVKSLGANESVDYKLPLDDQLQKIKDVTGGAFTRVFDASAMASETGMEALARHGSAQAGAKYFSTTNDWQPIPPQDGIIIDFVKLGEIGKQNSNAEIVNSSIKSFIPNLEKYITEGKLKPMTYEVVGEGMDGVLIALDYFGQKKSGEKKVLVKIA